MFNCKIVCSLQIISRRKNEKFLVGRHILAVISLSKVVAIATTHLSTRASITGALFYYRRKS